MAIDERRRSELYEGLAAAIGPEAAVTMFELLPPQGTELATRADIDRLDARIDGLEHRLDARIDGLEHRLDGFEQRIDDRLDGLRNELLAAFRGELVAAVAGQTRAVIIATATATFGIGSLAVALAQLLS
ncbi:MAG TPA: hypothetical protein VK906_13675 [Egicoccus sp.]|nr:hypothetical protein [Egicoccus sp.]HSK24230.1 hypothetical protein [Egicoccus sp.]